MKKYLSPFVCGFGAGVLQIVPVAKSFSCCFIISLAAFLSLMLDQKAKNSSALIPMKKGLIFGLITGLYAALFGSTFDIMITLITRYNDIIAIYPELQKIIVTLPITEEVQKEFMALFQDVRKDILSYGFSSIYTFSIIVNNLVVNSIFGIVGGLVSVQIINKKNFNQAE